MIETCTMLRFNLRTLLIALALAPPVLAGAWWGWRQYLEWSLPGEEMRLSREVSRVIYGPDSAPPDKPIWRRDQLPTPFEP